MWSYVLRRLAIGVVILFVASFLMFLLVSASGNPLATLEANPHIPPSTILAYKIQLHLNEPVLPRYWTWLTEMLGGNFGTSTTGQPVGHALLDRWLVTLKLVIPTVILAVIIAIVAGVISAVKQYSLLDNISTGIAYLFFATPVFIVGLLLKDFIAIRFNNAVGHTVLYTVGEVTPGTTGFGPTVTSMVEHSILPVITLTLVTYAGWSRYQRASMLDVLNADYVRLARAKGLSPRRVLYVHALRNALIPVVTVVALDFAGIMGGTILTETVFGWEGMGRYLYEGLSGPISPDVNVVLGWLMIAAAAVVVFNLVADLLYAVLDPRIRYA